MNEDRPLGCGFLSEAELEGALVRRLPAGRQTEWMTHARECADCALLLADAYVIEGVTAEGLTGQEAREYAPHARVMRALLRRGLAGPATASRRAPQPAAQLPWRWSWGVPVAVAAALLLLVIVPQTRHGSSAGLVTLPDGGQYRIQAMPLSQPPAVRGAGSSRLWDRAADLYLHGQYGQAASLLDRITQQEPEQADAWLYLGIALLMTGKGDAALVTLDQAESLARAQGLPVGAILWYRALALLSTGRGNEARDTLQQAASGGGPLAGQAERLLHRLEPGSPLP